MFVLRVACWPFGIKPLLGRRLGLFGLMLVVVGLGLGGCAQRPQEVSVRHSKEYFPSSVYGRASPRVIADGQPVPRGGGQYMVGKPYTIAGRTYYPSESRRTQVGMASWYGDAFHGRLTANREIYDRDGYTAASPTMPLPCYARVTNLRNNYSMIVRVNDRGPYASDRIMDVSRRVAEALDYKRYGTAKVKVEYVGRASLDGSDDTKLLATLRTNGPARWQSGEPTMIAEAEPAPTRVASIAPYAPAPSRYRVADRTRTRAGIDDEDDDRPVRRHVSRDDEDLPVRHSRTAPRETERAGRRFSIATREPEDGMPRRRFTGSAYRHETEVTTSRRHDYRTREAVPETRIARASSRPAVLPPSRPIDLATIPGAGSQIHARRTTSRLRMARTRDE